MRSRVVVALIGAVSVAAGCAYDPTLLDAGYTLAYEVPAVKDMAPQGPEFNQGLREGYLDLADSMGGDHPDRGHTARCDDRASSWRSTGRLLWSRSALGKQGIQDRSCQRVGRQADREPIHPLHPCLTQSQRVRDHRD